MRRLRVVMNLILGFCRP